MPKRSSSTFASLAATALLCAGSGSAEARVRFDPSLEAGVRTTNNVSFQGEGSDGESDTIGIVAATFHVAQEGTHSALNFRYRPELQRYQEFDELDHDEHRADLDWTTGLGRRATFAAEASYSLTQTQGVSQMFGDQAMPLTERTDRQFSRVQLMLEQQQGRLWSWNVSADGEANRFDPIEGLANPVGTSIEDRTGYGGEFGVSRQQSANTALGGQVRWERFDLETSGSEENVSLAATWDHRLAQTMTFTGEGGVFHNSGEAGIDDQDRYGVYLNFELERSWPERQFRMRVENRPTGGGALTGSSIDSNVTAAYESTGERTWHWGVLPQVGRRTSTEEGGDTIYGAGVRVEVGRRLGEHFETDLAVDYYSQSDDNSVAAAELLFSWNPLRRSRQASP